MNRLDCGCPCHAPGAQVRHCEPCCSETYVQRTPEEQLHFCVIAYYVATEAFDQQVCQFRMPDGTAAPTTPSERAACWANARNEQIKQASDARVSIPVFQEACRQFSNTPEWNTLLTKIANAPRSLR